MSIEDTERLERQRHVIDEHMLGESEHDWDRVYATFVQDDRAFWDSVPAGERHEGIAEVRRFYESQERTFPTARVEVTRSYDVPGTSIREVTISGVHTGVFEDIAANNRPYRFDAVGVYVFTDDDEPLILGERVYFDPAAIRRQLSDTDTGTSLGLAKRSDNRSVQATEATS